MSSKAAIRTAGSGADTDYETARARAVATPVIWWFLATGVACSAAAILLPSDNTRSFVWDGLGIVAAAGAVFGILGNKPRNRGVWQLFGLALVLFVAGDVVFDVAQRGFGVSDGYPYSDILYLSAYPVIAFALFRLAREHFARDTLFDSAIVAIAASAVIWQWVITPVMQTAAGATTERIVAVLYPIMDIVLVVVIVHAVFTLPRWMTTTWLLFAGLAVMLVADVLFARLVADGAYVDAGPLDALWPISYFLLAAAVMHPSMRELWRVPRTGLVSAGRSRVIVLGTALFAAPAVVIVDDSANGAAITLAVIAGLAAGIVAWRLARLVSETNRAREVLGESEARFRALVQHAVDIIVVVSRSGHLMYVSPSVSKVFGEPGADLNGVSFTDFLDEDGVQEGIELYDQLVAHPDQPVSTEFHVRNGTSWHWIEATWTNQLDEPAVGGIVGNLRVITERKRADDLSEAETRVLELILSGAPIPETVETLLDAVERFIPDASATVRLLDRETGRLACVSAPTLPADYVRTIEEHTTLADIEEVLSATELHTVTDVGALDHRPDLAAVCRAHGLRSLWSIPIRTPDAADFLGILGLYLRTEREPTAGERSLMERARDLIALAIDRAEYTRQLGHLALHDTLTGLPNRALAQDRLEHALARLAETDSMVAVLFLDLDRFKLVNDGLGHETGDELLVAVSRRLTASVRRGDTVARFGGDEFVVLCEDLTDEAHAQELAERAAQALAEPFVLSHAEVAVSASVGIAVTRRATDRASSLLRDADAAMYRAKRRGGARHELFDEAMHTQAVTRLLTERALRKALDRDELRVLFQPQFDIQTGERVAAEALLRWEHPVRGLVTPGEFIKVAEETGVIVPIGEWVLERACELALRSQSDGPDGTPLTISTNVSARQLQRPDFPSVVARVMREHGVDPATVCLEITESMLLEEVDATSEALRALKDQGVQLAIDDFGTGGSSLTYLRRFPFDELKVDQSFIAGLGRSAADDAIVAATIDMAHALGMIVAAEGVETEQQLVRLRELGCDRAQGYLLAVPQPVVSRRLELVHQRPA